jgi:hypothetical protein
MAGKSKAVTTQSGGRIRGTERRHPLCDVVNVRTHMPELE